MSASEFDELIRHKFDDYDIAYNPANWERMSERLDKKQPRRNGLMAIWPVIAGIAATAALLLAFPALWKHDVQNTAPIARSTKHTETVIPPATETGIADAPNKSNDYVTCTPATSPRRVKARSATTPVYPVLTERKEPIQGSTDVAAATREPVSGEPTKQLPRT